MSELCGLIGNMVTKGASDQRRVPNKPSGPMAVARRPWKTAAGQVLLLCGVSVAGATMIGIVSVLFAAGSLDMTVSPAKELLAGLGEAVRGELGSGLAVAASIQFGVLIALVGRQIDAGSTTDEMSLREALDVLGELPVVLLAPAVALATCGVIADGGVGAGALLVVLPVFTVQIGMSIVIATFEPADASALAERSEEWAARALENLQTVHRLPATPRRQFAAWVAGVASTLTAVAVVPLVFWRPETTDTIILILLFAALLWFTIVATLLIIAAENSSLKPRKAWATVIPIRILYIAVGSLFILFVLLGSFLYLPLGITAFLALILIGYWIRGSWQEAKAVRETSQFDGYTWWRGGMITRFGNRWSASEAATSLRSARAAVERYRSTEENSVPLTSGGRYDHDGLR